MKLRCDCQTHILEVEDFSVKNVPALSLCIYEIYSPKGRKYKKPKLSADVVIMNNHYPKEYTKLIKFIKRHAEKHNG